jgi:serine/threonine protein kinase
VTDLERRRRVEDLCDAALVRDARERAAFVAVACGHDEALRHEVEALLAHAQTAEHFLEAPIGELAAQILADDHRASLVGRQIGSHQILSLLGTGGMGDVYRARDTRLGRDVAIKVVASAFLSDPERLARFEREARVLATLNHPHIGAIYGLEEAEGVRGLLLELVEGQTLAERLASGPLLIQGALSIARQIAEALEAAHEKGIIHRDLKPANIKLTADGKVKVLDFGLAKAFDSEPTISSDPANSPTLTMRATQAGMIMGTPGYMSPEQASGQHVDKRADIWSFGVVLWEMLTGKRLFAGGETVAHTVADVLRAEIDFTRLPVATPAAIRELLRRCLDRDVKTRLRDIGEARVAIVG